MILPEVSRKYAFRFLDLLKGGNVRKHYRDIALVLNHVSSKEATQRKENALSAVLRHAVTTSRFYKPQDNFQSLNDFPVINKSIIRDSFDCFISCKFKEPQLVPVSTSGSTGTPFKVYHDKNKRLRNSADTLFFAQMAGYSIGDKLIYMKVWNEKNRKRSFNYWMENIIQVDVRRFNDTKIESLLLRMQDRKSKYNIIGYASALELVCKYLEKRNYGRVKADIKSVIAMSEKLNDYTKKSIQKYFNAPVVSRYSNLENGIIAQQEIAGSEKYLINTASYVVEILKMDSDEQTEPGQPGRIVITDLYNYGMPFIRYDTGDIGVMSQDSKKTGNMYLAKVEGRKLDMLYDTKGNLVSSIPIQYLCEGYSDIVQYQIIQEGRKEYTIKINAGGVLTKEMNLIRGIKTYLGEDAVIKFEYVSEIPLLSSGKRKIVVNNYQRIP